MITPIGDPVRISPISLLNFVRTQDPGIWHHNCTLCLREREIPYITKSSEVRGVEIAIMAVLLSSFLLVAGTVTSNDIESVYLQRRLKMVEEQIALRDVCDEEVLKAMRTVPRHKFVPEHLTDMAYCDTPLPIGMGQTISQPYIVAYMTELLGPVKGRKILEIGTGSGYQSAVLAEMGADVYTVEILEPLTLFARSIINGLGYKNVHFRTGDGYLGWEEHAPYDGIIVTAAAGEIPEPLKNQLREGGKMIIPLGDGLQELTLITRKKDGFDEEKVAPVAFVPMTGKAEKHGKNNKTV